MTLPHIELLSKDEIQAIHETSLKILKEVGVVVTSPEILDYMANAGAIIDKEKRTARFDENLVMWALESTGKKYILHGRNPDRVARYGYGDQNLISSPGQYTWFDHHTGERRQPTLRDTVAAATVGDALPNVTIACGMSVPMDVPEGIRDVVVTAQLVKTTSKPTWCWPSSRQSSKYILEIYKAVAGGKEALKQKPMVEVFLEPISPLQLADPSLTNVIEYIDHGQPVSVGPMASVTGTGPATLAGTLAQENAEILAGIVAVQAIGPGTPMMYGGIPHILDARTASFVFSSPEQALMAVSMTQIGKHYGLPVYVNVNLSDSKSLDAQAGMEKMGTLVPAMLAGADLFGHAGILGEDHGASLLWLIVDNEAIDFAKRLLKGFQVDEDRLAAAAIADVGPGGNFLFHPHTRSHFRQEQWFPSDLWARQTYEAWEAEGAKTITDRAIAKVDHILAHHQPEPIDPLLSQEIDRIVETARRELLGA